MPPDFAILGLGFMLAVFATIATALVAWSLEQP